MLPVSLPKKARIAAALALSFAFARPPAAAEEPEPARVARDADESVWRRRFDPSTNWKPFEFDDAGRIVWSPTGRFVAYEPTDGATTSIDAHRTDFYLQDVRNLNKFRELSAVRSKRLERNGFVARPGGHREFYALYDTLRYRRRPQFVTADAALQVYRDEFIRILDAAEAEAERRLWRFTDALWSHYWSEYQADGEAIDLHWAEFFATAWVPLRAARAIRSERTDRGRPGPAGDDREPMIDRLPDRLPDALAELPDELRSEDRPNLDRMTAHKGFAKRRIPGMGQVRIDWSQFKPRGPYAENDRGAYFLAMNWFALVPMPFDQSLVEFEKTLETLTADDQTLRKLWQSVADTAGSFLGRPADPTVSHLDALADEKPDLWSSFDRRNVADALSERVGDVSIRDAASAGPDSESRDVKVVLFPKRTNLDSSIFSKLTAPTVRGRSLASSLDAFGVLAGNNARKLAIENTAETFRASYREALDKLRGEFADRDDLYPTDIYHSWLAAVVALAKPHDLPQESTLEFAKSEAWQSRRLHSALAGYTELKHASILYAAQDIGMEGSGGNPLLVMLERPVLPRPEGFVDPEPAVFQKLARLARTTYDHLRDGEAPTIVTERTPRDKPPHAATLASQLAEIARREVDGKPLRPEDYAFIERIGPLLEAATLGGSPDWVARRDAREQYGIPVVADIHTSATSGRVREVGVGYILDLYVAVDDGIGRRMTHGGAWSFYEFTRPMSDRLDDQQWNEMLSNGEGPKRPDWTSTFLQPVETDWRENSK